MTQSIKNQLLRIVIGTVILFGILIIVYTWIDTNHSVHEMFDTRLQREAQLVIRIAREEHHQTTQTRGMVPWPLESSDYENTIVYKTDMAMQVWISGKLRALTESTPGFPDPVSADFSNMSFNSKEWRVLYFMERFEASSGDTAPIDIWVAIGEPVAERQAIITKMLWQSSLPLIAIIFLLVVTLYWGIGIALKPLDRIRKQIIRRSPQALDAVESEDIPQELKPFVTALNTLLEKLKLTLEKEKQFTADAAHELRTPLSGLMAQAQVAAREPDDELRERALRRIIQGAKRASRLVNQLLTLARLDPDHVIYDTKDFKILPMLEDMLADLAPEAKKREVEVTLHTHGSDAVVVGEQGLIEILLRNIVHNAIIYAAESEGLVEIDIHTDGEFCHFIVNDNGPGIPEENISQVFDRFYRAPGNASFGAGLGLSIASTIARLHQTSLKLVNRSGPGLSASVALRMGASAQLPARSSA